MTAALALTWRQYRLERKMFWRNPSAAFFNFVLPLLFLALFGAIFSGSQEDLDIIVPGIAGMSIMTTTFVALAMNLVFLREQGVLKRLRGTPLPSGAYLASLAAHAMTNTTIQLTIVIGAGALLFGVGLPENWFMLAVFVGAGVACLASLGVALSHAIPNFDSAPAYVNAIFLPVIVLSGVFYDAEDGADVPARHRPGAAADAPHRRPVGGDGHRRAVRRPPRRPRRAADLGRAGHGAGGARLQLGGAAGLTRTCQRSVNGVEAASRPSSRDPTDPVCSLEDTSAGSPRCLPPSASSRGGATSSTARRRAGRGAHLHGPRRWGSLVIRRTGGGLTLVDRDRFMAQMAGELGYGRMLYDRQPVERLTADVPSLVLDEDAARARMLPPPASSARCARRSSSTTASWW